MLADFIASVSDFDACSPREKILILSWFLHEHRGEEVLTNSSLRGCFKELHLPAPDMAVYLPRMAAGRTRDLIRVRGGYKLERSGRQRLATKFGSATAVTVVSRLLSELPSRLTIGTERVFLEEALSCYRVKAYRAAIVMTWNLAFDHLVSWVLADANRVGRFNDALKKRYPKKAVLQIRIRDDFEELKESEIIEVCSTASLFSKNIVEVLREKLKRRNIAAHPSQTVMTQSQADDAITDLVNNVVVALPPI